MVGEMSCPDTHKDGSATVCTWRIIEPWIFVHLQQVMEVLKLLKQSNDLVEYHHYDMEPGDKYPRYPFHFNCLLPGW